MKPWKVLLALVSVQVLMVLAQAPPGATPVRTPLDELQAQEAVLNNLRDDMQKKTMAAQSATIMYLQGEQNYKAAHERATLDCKGSLSVLSGVWRCVPNPATSEKKTEKKSVQ